MYLHKIKLSQITNSNWPSYVTTLFEEGHFCRAYLKLGKHLVINLNRYSAPQMEQPRCSMYLAQYIGAG